MEKEDKNNTELVQPMSGKVYGIVSAIGLVSAIIGFILFYKDIGTESAQDRFYYLLLLLLGLGVAAFLFGFMKSYAVYRGSKLSPGLALGGPVVVAALVVYGGFKLIPKEELPFNVKIIVETINGDIKDVAGDTIYMVELNMQPKYIDPLNSQVEFSGIDAKFLNQEVHFGFRSDGYELVDADSSYLLQREGVLYLQVKRDQSLAILRGTVLDVDGNSVSGIHVQIEGVTVFDSTDVTGTFELQIPPEFQKQSLEVRLISSNYMDERYTVFPGSKSLPSFVVVPR